MKIIVCEIPPGESETLSGHWPTGFYMNWWETLKTVGFVMTRLIITQAVHLYSVTKI